MAKVKHTESVGMAVHTAPKETEPKYEETLVESIDFEPEGSLDQEIAELGTESIAAMTKEVDKNLESFSLNLEEEQEQTRSWIGKVFVRGFFIFLIVGILGVMVYNIFMYAMTGETVLFLDTTKLLTLIGSIIGTPLGFVMGYYFKGRK